MHTSGSDHGGGGACRNELRHWRELMTGKAGLWELCSSSGAAFHHQSVSPGKRCDFLCASVMTSCTWLSLHSPVLPGTLSAAFLNQVPLTQFLFKQYTIGWYAGTPAWGFLHLHHALWIFGFDSSKPQGAVDLLLHHNVLAGTWIWKSLLFVIYWPTSPDSLQIRDIASGLLSVSMCVFTHPAAPSIPMTPPKRLPGLYLICTHQSNLGPGWQAHFPPTWHGVV